MLVWKPSWHDDIAVIVSLLAGVVAALDEELAQPVTVEAGSGGNAVWSARRNMLCAYGGRFLGCTCLRVKANSLR